MNPFVAARRYSKILNRVTYVGGAAEIGAGEFVGANGKIAEGVAFQPNGNMALVFTGGGFNHLPNGDLPFTPDRNIANGNFIY